MSRLLLSFLLVSLLLFCFSQDKINYKAEYNAADKIYQQAKEFARQAEKDENKQEAANQLYRQAYAAFTRVILSIEKSGNDSLAFFSSLKAAFAGLYLDSVDVAMKDYLSVIALKQKLPAIPDSFLFLPYLYTGGIFYSKDQFDSALSFYKKAEQINDKYTGHLNESQRLYNRLGAMYYETGNYRQARNYFEKAISVLMATDPGNSGLLANYKINIASLHINLEEFSQAKSVYNSLLSYNVFQNEIYHNLGIIYLKEKDFKKSIEYFRKVNYEDNKNNIDLYYYFGVAYSALNEIDSSEFYLQKALAENAKWNGHRKNIQYGLIRKFQADELAKQGTYKEAIAQYQQAVIQFYNDFKETDIYKNPEQFTGVFSFINLFNTLIAKADAYETWYQQEKNSELLNASLNTYQSAFKLADYVEKTYDSDEARLFLGKIKYTAHTKPIDVCLLLYDLTQKRNFLEEAYLFDQKNKASILTLNVQENELRTASGKSNQLIRQESTLKTNITRISLKAAHTTDSLELLQLNTAIRDNEIELGKLQEKIKGDPAWQQKKSIVQIPSVGQLQKKLDNSSALLSFHLSEDELQIILITPSRFEYHKSPISKNFFATIDSFKTALHNVSADHRYNGTNVSTRLYEKLISPLQSKLSQTKRLIIIPDDELNYLPFEALQDKNKKYLVERFSVQYQYSTALLGENEKRAHIPGTLSFAPFTSRGYSDSSGFSLSSLPASKDEVTALEGMAFTDSDATKKNFLGSINQYGTIHLATHASVNNENPFRSFIAFYPGNTDYKLFTQEISNLKLDSTRLVILSACETGAGQLVKGEGLMSLSRAFAYAGCPNIITSLWKAEDKTTAFLTQRLHYYLDKKYTKDKALQQAKLDLMNNKDMDPRFKSPNYWAHLLFIGEYETNYDAYKWWWIALAILAAAIVYIFAKRKSLLARNKQA